MKSTLLSLVAILLFSTLSAQNLSKIDSLSSLLQQADSTTQAAILNQIAWEYRLSYPDSTIFYCQQVIDLKTSQHAVAEAFNFTGIAYMYKGNYAEAFRYHREALDYAKNIADSSQMAHAYNNLGRLFFTQGDMIKSYDFFVQALHIFEEIQNEKGIGYCYQSLMQLYKLQNDQEKALDMLQKALVIRTNADDARGQISTLKELAQLYAKTQDFERAQHYLFQAENIADSIGDKISMAEIDLALADLHWHQQDYQQAMDRSRRALVTAGGSNNQNLLSSIYLMLAKIYNAQHAYRKAKLYFNKVISFAKKTGNLKNQKESYYYLSEIYKANQDYQQALAFHRQYLLLKDSIYDTDVARTIERLENRLQMEAKDKEYELLKAAAAKNQMIIRQERIKNIAKSVIIGLVLLLLLVLYIFYHRIRKKNRLLLEQKEQIEQQNHAIVKQNVRIQEQNLSLMEHNHKLDELSREKDTLMNILAHDLKAPFNRIKGLSELILRNLGDDTEREKYAYLVKETAEDGVTLIRDLLDANAFERSNDLQCTEVDLKTLMEHLAARYQAVAQPKDIRIHLSIQDDLHLKTDKLYLTRILDNLVSNAIKYSYTATSVFLKAYSDKKGQISLSVKDEGPGFSVEDKKHLYQKFRKLSARPTQGESSHGLGLAIVKTLVTRLEAKIVLISEPRQGSEFVITFPAYQEEMIKR